MARRRKRRQSVYEFKPDPKGTNYLKRLYMTRLQRLTILKWGTYALTGIFLLVIQDVIMSQMRFSGATTDLPVAFILLVGIYEGLENGSVFTLAASLFYWFSGSAPTPICVAILCILVIFIGLFLVFFTVYLLPKVETLSQFTFHYSKFVRVCKYLFHYTLK